MPEFDNKKYYPLVHIKDASEQLPKVKLLTDCNGAIHFVQ